MLILVAALSLGSSLGLGDGKLLDASLERGDGLLGITSVLFLLGGHLTKLILDLVQVTTNSLKDLSGLLSCLVISRVRSRSLSCSGSGSAFVGSLHFLQMLFHHVEGGLLGVLDLLSSSILSLFEHLLAILNLFVDVLLGVGRGLRRFLLLRLHLLHSCFSLGLFLGLLGLDFGSLNLALCLSFLGSC